MTGVDEEERHTAAVITTTAAPASTAEAMVPRQVMSTIATRITMYLLSVRHKLIDLSAVGPWFELTLESEGDRLTVVRWTCERDPRIFVVVDYNVTNCICIILQL